MSSSTTKLPIELLSKITRNVTSQNDLLQLRGVNSIFNSLATPAVFSSVIVVNQEQIAENFYTLMHTPHIARHVKSIKYVESMSDFDTGVARYFKLAFSTLHQASGLKMLSLYFQVDYTGKHCTGEALSHQWTIIEALGINIKRVPKLQSLKIFGWLDVRKSISLFEKAHIARLTASLRHLNFSLPMGAEGQDSLAELHELFWKNVVVRHMLKPAINLESLAIKRDAFDAQFFDISQLVTYPRLVALSLKNIVWEDGTTGQGGTVVPSPLEDFIVRHGKTLKILKLSRCSIMVKEYGRVLPLCYWADVYERLANALTELVELEVRPDEMPYLSSTRPPNMVMLWNYYRLKRLDGIERDEEALREFKEVVKERAMDTGLEFDREAKGWSGWDQESDEE